MRKWCLVGVWMAMCASVSYGAIEVLFVGVRDGAAPSFEKSFEKLLRDYLVVSPNIKLIDVNSFDRVCVKMGSNSVVPLDRASIEYMSRRGMDSTLVIWCTIKKYGVEVMRKRIFGSDIVGSAEIQVSMYYLRDKNYLYAGDVIANVHSSGPILFFDVAKDARPSAAQIVSITEMLQKDASLRTMSMIRAVITANLTGEVKTEVTTEAGVDRYKEPSLSDVFNVPSIEGDMLQPAQEEQPAQVSP